MGINGTGIDEAELQREREKTNRHLRLAEMLRQYSKEAEMIVMPLPLPRKGQSPALYAAWLDNDQGYAAKSSHPWKPRDRPHFLQLVRLTPSQKLVQLCKFI